MSSLRLGRSPLLTTPTPPRRSPPTTSPPPCRTATPSPRPPRPGPGPPPLRPPFRRQRARSPSCPRRRRQRSNTTTTSTHSRRHGPRRARRACPHRGCWGPSSARTRRRTDSRNRARQTLVGRGEVLGVSRQRARRREVLDVGSREGAKDGKSQRAVRPVLRGGVARAHGEARNLSVAMVFRS
ncbi:hypothetical protein DMC30DRAFT_397690 [Rhodotorula diobovata]|uniref:Uncharacterized protein n=1 Tax=Rhodotorula diobovata TaxID=5288 RepID=A0A5C5FVU5_9BASI|nr:hypothetical protein DMC30DRAFT_397690 [Rhodotorula diobovata]